MLFRSIHWPFCLSKCPYCDFNSHVRREPIDEVRFTRAFAAEIAATAARVPGRRCRRRRARELRVLKKMPGPSVTVVRSYVSGSVYHWTGRWASAVNRLKF